VQASGFALGAACFIAAYCTIDGIGARHAGLVHGYAFLLFVLKAIPMVPIAINRRALRRFSNQQLPEAPRSLQWCSACWRSEPMTEPPIAAVAALRETGAIFGILLSALIFHEGSIRTRAPAAICVTAGAFLLQM
tara:strand:+ start:161 stop:565 length:405 start_codon:yes stop_codon:yes gene_type:complete